MFTKNSIIEFQEADQEKIVERILWVDEGSIICYTIDLNNKNALPVKRKILDLEELLNNELLQFVKEEPFPFVYQSEEKISQKQKEIRNERWNLIKEICLIEPDIYISQKRGPMIKQVTEKTGVFKASIYIYLRTYWQRGSVKNALLPNYRNCGAPGKERKLGENKTGRKRKFENELGKGINVTEEIKRVFQVSIRQFYHTSKGNSLRIAYEMMIKNYFVESYYYEDRVKKNKLKENSQLPTFRQFEYWYRKTYSVEEKNRRRKGNKKYELEHRAVLGTSTGEMYGPGTKYQVDATIADVYLVSNYNRNWIIGRPVIYVVIDVFSRMVTGLYVGLEGPSWLGASMALANAASNKVEFCKRYGIHIKSEEWSTNYLPQTLLADRGEIEGRDIERLINAFNMKVENTPPYRADWKGIVEQHFRTINLKVKPFLPGVVDKNVRVRGERDYRLDAQLTIEEFTYIIIKCVLHHNNFHWLKNYDANKMMLKDEVKLIPRELWNWGIKNRSGYLRSFTEDIVKLHLLPQGSARVTYKGIVFKGMKYSCEKALKEGWFSQAREKSWIVEVSYDPRNMNYLYIQTDDAEGYEVCKLLSHQQKYAEKSVYDVEYLHAYEQYKTAAYEHEELEQKIDLQAEIEKVVQQAKKQSQKNEVPISNQQKLKGIRENREFHKAIRQKEEAFLLATYEEAQVTSEANSLSEKPSLGQEELQKSASKIDLLRQKQREIKERAKRKSTSPQNDWE